MEKQQSQPTPEGKTSNPEQQTHSDQPEHFNSTSHTTGLSPGLPIKARRQQVIRLQRSIGNAATQRQIDYIQRQETKTAAVWKPPFGLPSASTFEEAVERLDDISTKLAFADSDVIPPHDAKFSKSSDSIDEITRQFVGKTGPLEKSDVSFLNATGIAAEMVYNEGVEATRTAIKNGVKKITVSKALDTMQEQIAERLHFAFVKKKEEDILDKLKSGLDAVSKYKGYADKVVSWGETIADVTSSTSTADFLKKINGYNATINQVIGHASSIVGAANSIKGIYFDKGSGTSFDSLSQFQSAIDGIDVASGLFSSVPLFGTLWSSYYKPLTQACFKHLDKILEHVDKMKRDMALLEWMEDPHHERTSTGAPRIPEELIDAFPGGQPIMNFMWPLVNGQGMQPITQGIHDFFLPYIDQLNAGLPDDEKLQSGDDRSDWNPLSWFTDNKVVGLENYLQNHSRTLWAMLYGSMPTTI